MIVADGSAVIELLLNTPSGALVRTRLLDRAWELRDNLTIYDAVYVALAEALDAPLLTRDARLARAQHAARIELV